MGLLQVRCFEVLRGEWRDPDAGNARSQSPHRRFRTCHRSVPRHRAYHRRGAGAEHGNDLFFENADGSSDYSPRLAWLPDSAVAAVRLAHNLKAAGSNPAPQSKINKFNQRNSAPTLPSSAIGQFVVEAGWKHLVVKARQVTVALSPSRPLRNFEAMRLLRISDKDLWVHTAWLHREAYCGHIKLQHTYAGTGARSP
jgi:hypothetical protein